MVAPVTIVLLRVAVAAPAQLGSTTSDKTAAPRAGNVRGRGARRAAPCAPERPCILSASRPSRFSRPARAARFADSLGAAQPVPADLQDRAATLTLPDVVDLALRNNPATRTSWAQARAAADAYGAARGSYFPTVSAVVNGGRSE